MVMCLLEILERREEPGTVRRRKIAMFGLRIIGKGLYSYGNTLDLPTNQSNGIKKGQCRDEMKKNLEENSNDSEATSPGGMKHNTTMQIPI
jgi:hypothetical protein